MAEIYLSNGSLDGDSVGLDSPIFGGVLIMGVFGGYILLQAMEFTAEITGSVMSDGGKGVTSITNTAKSGINGMGSVAGGVGGGVKALKSMKAAQAAKAAKSTAGFII